VSERAFYVSHIITKLKSLPNSALMLFHSYFISCISLLLSIYCIFYYSSSLYLGTCYFVTHYEIDILTGITEDGLMRSQCMLERWLCSPRMLAEKVQTRFETELSTPVNAKERRERKEREERASQENSPSRFFVTEFSCSCSFGSYNPPHPHNSRTL